MLRTHLLTTLAFSALACMATDDAAASGGTNPAATNPPEPETAAATAPAEPEANTDATAVLGDATGKAHADTLDALRERLEGDVEGTRPEPEKGQSVYRVVGEYRDKVTNEVHLVNSLVALHPKRHEQLTVNGGAGVVSDEPVADDEVDESVDALRVRDTARAELASRFPVDDAIRQDGADGEGSPIAEHTKGMSTGKTPAVLKGGRRGGRAGS